MRDLPKLRALSDGLIEVAHVLLLDTARLALGPEHLFRLRTLQLLSTLRKFCCKKAWSSLHTRQLGFSFTFLENRMVCRDRMLLEHLRVVSLEHRGSRMV